jgi:hypothetical protein
MSGKDIEETKEKETEERVRKKECPNCGKPC